MSIIKAPAPTDGATRKRVALFHTGADTLSTIFSGLTLDLCNLQGELHNAGVFATLHKCLLLPETYAVIGVFFSWGTREWQILLESPELPETTEGYEIPQVRLWYSKREDGTKLDSIQIIGRTPGNLGLLKRKNQ